MAKLNSFLSKRFKTSSESESKMTSLAELSTTGNLSSFSGVFRVTSLSENEEAVLENLLNEYKEESCDVAEDLQSLSMITSEVKAINNQAAILHGERIKKAQDILKEYRDGAFTTWLVAIYGNRQTPYNFLQYYEFYTALPKMLHSKLDEMPRQAVYTLASRTGDQEKKEEIVKNYNGQTKQELLAMIRELFPLAVTDKRKPDLSNQAIQALERLEKILSKGKFHPNTEQRKRLLGTLDSLRELIERRPDFT